MNINGLKTYLKNKNNLLILITTAFLFFVFGILITAIVFNIFIKNEKSNLNTKADVIEINEDIDQVNKDVMQKKDDKEYKHKSVGRYLFQSKEDGDIAGYAELEGYYFTEESEFMGSTTPCSKFRILNGTIGVIESMINIDNQSGLNEQIAEANLSISIDYKDLSQQDIELIESSSENKLIKISVLKEELPHRGVNICYSPYDIIDVELIQ